MFVLGSVTTVHGNIPFLLGLLLTEATISITVLNSYCCRTVMALCCTVQ